MVLARRCGSSGLHAARASRLQFAGASFATDNASHFSACRPKSTCAHDGSVTFFAYDARGREIERATFPAGYHSATTRPPLSAATSVISTRWHATFNLPTQRAEPGRISAWSYSAKGLPTGSSWTATTDGTGAAKFSASKTGSTYATGYSYTAAGLVSTVVERETPVGGTALETQRWTMAYNAAGDLTRVTDVTGGNLIGRASAYDAQGRLLRGTAVSGSAVSMAFNARGKLTEYSAGDQTMRFLWTAFGELQRIDGPGSDVVIYEYDAAQRLTGVRKSLSTASRTDGALRQFAQRLRSVLEGPIPVARAQPAPPLTPVQGGVLAGLGLARPPVSTYPGDALFPAQSGGDPNREIARRLGESVQRVVERLLCAPECKLLQAEIEEWTGAVRKRYFNMIVDKNNLFCTRPEGRFSWAGHQKKYGGDQQRLRDLIQRARAKGCPYNPEADDWARRPAPTCPG